MLINDPASNRASWEFTYTVSKVLEGARAQMEFRKVRLAYWTDQRDTVMKDIAAKGLTVSAPELEKMSATYGRRGATIHVDDEMQHKLDDALAGVERNNTKLGEYEAWVEFLAAGKPEDTLKLKHADWMFFFGKR